MNTKNTKFCLFSITLAALPLISLISCSNGGGGQTPPEPNYQEISIRCEEEMNSILPANQRPSIDDVFGTSAGGISTGNFLDGINECSVSNNFITRLPSERYKELEITWGFCQRVLLGYSKSFTQEGNSIIEVENPSIVIPGLEDTEIIVTVDTVSKTLTGGNTNDYVVVNSQPNAIIDDVIKTAGYSLNWTMGTRDDLLYAKTQYACGSDYKNNDICFGSNWFGMIFGTMKSNLMLLQFTAQLSIPSYYYQNVTDVMLRPIA